MNHKAVLEIGTEEIPAKLVKSIHQNLLNVSKDILSRYRINSGEIEVMGTPRRLVVIFNNISEQQEKLVEEIKGPPHNIAFDEQGEATRAAEGFAQSQGVAVADLEIRDTDNGKYMFAVVERENQAAAKLLPGIFSEIITSLNFPISMRWGDCDLEFIRPIHWLLGLFDDKVLKFSVENIESGNTSSGHRFIDGSVFTPDNAAGYLSQLRQHNVIVDPGERRQIILEGIEEIESEYGGQALIDEDLLEEVVHLVEYPTPFCGQFEEKYLQLPHPVLVTPIKEHQRYFPMQDKDGELQARFIGVRDGGEKYVDIVREGNEKVIRARLADAEFYYEKDLQESMAARIEKLKGLVFREELGTMYDKVKRLELLSEGLAKQFNLNNKELENTVRAAHLAKADLVSNMVKEFPELQGTMGKIYAELENEPPGVAQAIEEHYYPRFAEDVLPTTNSGKIVSAADKMDTITGCFGIGLSATGSEDPYGLRRSAMGVIRILKEAKIELSLEQLCRESFETFIRTTQDLKISEDELVKSIVEFLLGRMEFLLEEKGIDYDVIKAVTGGINDCIPDMEKAAGVLDQIRGEEEFIELVTAYIRVQNIIKDHKPGAIKKEFFLEKCEQNLYNVFLEVKEKVNICRENKDYIGIYEHLTDLIGPVHTFFEKVMIMVDDPEIRENRLSLLAAIYGLMSRLGDLSQIVYD